MHSAYKFSAFASIFSCFQLGWSNQCCIYIILYYLDSEKYFAKKTNYRQQFAGKTLWFEGKFSIIWGNFPLLTRVFHTILISDLRSFCYLTKKGLSKLRFVNAKIFAAELSELPRCFDENTAQIGRLVKYSRFQRKLRK